jgi:Uma2 family endonuclease
MVEVRLPEAKPAFEWVNGRALQKVSPKLRHAVAQTAFVVALERWARSRRAGVAGTEWRFRLKPPGEMRRPLVPDVAFLSYARLPFARMQKVEEPVIAPDVAVEVKSPRDRKADIAEKVRVYLACGTSVVFLVDPSSRTVDIFDDRGISHLGADGVIRHEALPRFRLEVRKLFELPRPRRLAKK